jgi:CHASE3 domain sensor protein
VPGAEDKDEDEKLLASVQDLLERYKETTARVNRALGRLRMTQASGRQLLEDIDDPRPNDLMGWNCDTMTKTFAMTRQLAENYKDIGYAMAAQAGLVEEINERIARIKEKLAHGKVDQ